MIDSIYNALSSVVQSQSAVPPGPPSVSDGTGELVPTNRRGYMRSNTNYPVIARVELAMGTFHLSINVIAIAPEPMAHGTTCINGQLFNTGSRSTHTKTKSPMQGEIYFMSYKS